jgi:phosphoserine aminotransferase
MAIMTTTIPAVRPACGHFSSGPCAKRPGWRTQNLDNALVGRSHRAKDPKAKLKLAIDFTRELLQVPSDYRVGIVPGSDTGAVEMALWSLLGQRGVDVLAWESFGDGWVADVVKQLKLSDARVLKAGYGDIVDLASVNSDNDVVTLSWQKALGGEAGQGMLILSPRAVERLLSYSPAWPLPKLFRLTSGGKLIEGIFEGETINTPSMLCVEDYIDALRWGKSVGGLKALIARADANAEALAGWVAKTPWIDFLAKEESVRSNTSVCLEIVDPAIAALGSDAQSRFAKSIASLLEKEKIAYDIGAYRDAPPGLRIWCGATVETSNIEALTHWLDYAFEKMKSELSEAA